MTGKVKKVLAAMSGGVDSSVAAFLMKEAGCEVTGVTMKLYENETAGFSRQDTCCSLDDVEDARAVCASLGIPHHVFNFTGEFEERVIRRFIEAYERGETPNPCIDCNRYIKFSRLFKRGLELEQDMVVTGHYARISFDEGSGRWLLKRGLDPKKDQSYVLTALTQEQLAFTGFPLGDLTKEEVREVAEEQGFINARKHDSQDICFVPDGDYAGFITRFTGKDYPEGDFVDREGRILGRHRGIIRYTIGQRKGLGLALKEPMYVVEKDMAANNVILGRNADLFSRELDAFDFNWIALSEPGAPVRGEGKIRYSQKASPCTVYPLGGGKVHIEFDEPERAVTKGQTVAVYDGDVVIGGGTIL